MATSNQYRKQLDKLFSCTRRLISDPLEEHQRIRKELACPFSRISLFQYRRCSKNSFYAFSKNQIILANPLRFNDPFDTYAFCDRNKVIQSFEELTAEELRKLVDHVRKKDFSEEEVKYVGGNNVVEMIKVIASVPQEELEKKFYPNFIEIRNQGKKNTLDAINFIINYLKSSSRIACFSETCSSPIMWGHYADSGKGFCVKYLLKTFINSSFNIENFDFPRKSEDISNIENSLMSLLPVIYKTTRFDCTNILSERFKINCAHRYHLPIDLSQYDLLSIFKFACYKSTDWKYEKEWRLILSPVLPETPDYLPVAFVKSTEALYLGNNIAPDDKEMLLEYAKNLKNFKGQSVPVFEMNADWSSQKYKLIPKRIY